MAKSLKSIGVKNNVKHEVSKLFYGRIILNRKYYNNNDFKLRIPKRSKS